MKDNSSYSIAITGLGMVSSVGHDVKTACASIRAGVKRPEKLQNFYADSPKGYDEWEDGLVTGHSVLEGDVDDTEGRMCRLLSAAIDDIADDAGLVESDDLPLFLALPGKERDLFSDQTMDDYIIGNKALFPHVSEVLSFPSGHAAGIMALERATEAIGAGKCDRALVAGVDSLIGFSNLSRLNRMNRLKTEMNSNGLIPGEAAAVVLVEDCSKAEQRKAAIQGFVEASATGFESHHCLAGGHAGSGLSDTVDALFPPEEKNSVAVRAMITDLNGESYRSDEMSMMHARIFSRMGGEKELLCPARSTGDTGAASSCVAMCLAARTMIRGGFGHTDCRCLILSSSESGERGALLMTFNTVPDKGD
ncbi:beta-ketoacyl synthase N-terminal-like domain-containing protein [Desulfoluna spongiiphila]|uniref:3-oxoacyl-[acyl-carrier-protein] synthase-1 n=1 Tax=Desulfoluna spongiiphila TaxID=419481 RepID=A0A1G5E2X7_9BACT|nr:beta-ketoacyl synthase N-terminal-like domain-containing protein [Desulfoluna spongiiphila]SCY20838.1 3-oxoacyl-[acyl-carrier-protein] synthase-1 [Desulfoluna spongiiphila]